MTNDLEKLLKNPDRLEQWLRLHPPLARPQPSIPQGWGSYPEELTDASVLLLLQPSRSGTQLWFVQRSPDLRKHAGQIAFPGGKPEAHDASLWHTALRESQEEIGLEPGGVRQLGQLDQCWTPSGFRIHPFLGWNAGHPPQALPNSEIERAFCVPLAELVQAQEAEPPWPRYATSQGVVWGATGRILHGCLQILQEAST